MSVADFPGASSDGSLTTSDLRRQYELFPYPSRDAETECRTLRVSELGDLEALNHYGFHGRRDFRDGFRVLVAGAGTGDGSIYLAHQLVGTDASIVHLDLSRSSIDVARDRARRRNLSERIAFVQGSLLDLPESELGRFDYIECCGELTHLDDPLRGLIDLRSVLKDDGVIGLSVEGRYGRTGVSQARQLLQTVNGDEDDLSECLITARQVLAALPASNWLCRTPNHLPPVGQMDDAEIVDMFLNTHDRSFSVGELYELLEEADLHLVEFARTYRLLYRPLLAIHSKRLRRRIAELPRWRQQAVAEMLWGIVPTHSFWISPSSGTMADPWDADNVPFVPARSRQADLLQSAADPSNEYLKLRSQVPGVERLTLRLPLDETARRFLALVDGRRTMGEVVIEVAGTEMPLEAAWTRCVEVFEGLRSQDALLLRHKSIGA